MSSRMITLRVTDESYHAIKRHAESDRMSMNAWVESVLDAEDMRRRCAAHAEWLARNPDEVAFAEAWADNNVARLAERR